MKIKICGITTLREVEFVNKLKPDYIGVVLAESKRNITISTAKLICEKLNKDIKKVAVFKDNSFIEIAATLENTDIDIVQLHGNESKKLIEIIKETYNVEVWRGLSIENYKDKLLENIDKVIFDSAKGGSGQVFNWDSLNKIKVKQEIYLAGGINLENIYEALKVKGISGIDISSGVEDIKENGLREKSFIKMKKIIEKVREYDEK